MVAKGDSSGHPVWHWTRKEFIAESFQDFLGENPDFDVSELEELSSVWDDQRETWGQIWDTQMQNVPRDADVQPHVLESMPASLQGWVLRWTEGGQ